MIGFEYVLNVGQNVVLQDVRVRELNMAASPSLRLRKAMRALLVIRAELGYRLGIKASGFLNDLANIITTGKVERRRRKSSSVIQPTTEHGEWRFCNGTDLPVLPAAIGA